MGNTPQNPKWININENHEKRENNETFRRSVFSTRKRVKWVRDSLQNFMEPQIAKLAWVTYHKHNGECYEGWTLQLLRYIFRRRSLIIVYCTFRNNSLQSGHFWGVLTQVGHLFINFLEFIRPNLKQQIKFLVMKLSQIVESKWQDRVIWSSKKSNL